MASAFISENPEQSIIGLIIVGCRNNGAYPLPCEKSLKNVNIPILDICGGSNVKDARAARDREKFISKNYKQVEISGASHKSENHENELVSIVVNWLRAQ